MLDRYYAAHTTDNVLRYRSDIDGLRAIAVLSVVFFHAGIPGFSGGFVGVDVFFVISGYLITSLILNDIENGCFSFKKFYLRRAKRIFPALIVMLAITSVAALFILYPVELKKFGRSLGHTTYSASNFYFAKDSGYFSAPAIDKPLLHTWSLAIEEQFYIIFPLILALLIPRIGRSGVVRTLSILAIGSLLVGEYFVQHASEKAFFMPHVRAWELLLGGILAFEQNRLRVGHGTAFLLSLLGIIAIIFSISAIKATTPFPGLNAVLPCVGAALLLLAGGKQNTIVQDIIALSPMRFIGRISYSLYLWHWPLFSLTHYQLGRAPDAIETAALIIASFILAILSWSFVEQPIRNSAIGSVNPLRGIAAIGYYFIPFAIFGIVLSATGGLPSLLSANALEAYNKVMKTRKLFKRCHAAAKDKIVNSGCEFGSLANNKTYDVVMWGDSHALHFIPTLENVVKDAGLSGVTIWQHACAPLRNTKVLNHDGSLLCEDRDLIIDEFLKSNANVKAIIIFARWSMYANGIKYITNSEHGDLSIDTTKIVMKEELQKTVNHFRSKGLEVVVVGQASEFPHTSLRCNLRKIKYPDSSQDCSLSYDAELDKYIGYTNEVIANLDSKSIFTRIFPHEFICSKTTCDSMVNGIILHYDGNHLTPDASALFAPFFQEKLTPLLSRLKAEKIGQN